MSNESTNIIDRKFMVMEIFGPTIQGEGELIGTRTGFIRFGLCDYRCGKCDSLHAVDPKLVAKNAKRMTAQQILDECMRKFPITSCEWVTISGGNPAIQQLKYVVELLQEYGYLVNVETQGTECPPWLTACDLITVSPKLPGMGVDFNPHHFKRFMYDLVKHENTAHVCVKAVVFSRHDLECVSQLDDILDEVEHDFSYLTKYLSLGNSYPPAIVDGEVVELVYLDKNTLQKQLLNDYAVMAEEILQMPELREWIFLPQLHVLAWGNKGGV